MFCSAGQHEVGIAADGLSKADTRFAPTQQIEQVQYKQCTMRIAVQAMHSAQRSVNTTLIAGKLHCTLAACAHS